MSYTPLNLATATSIGLVQLAGDLGGTATAPTVPSAARVTGGGMETVSASSLTGSTSISLANGNVFNATLTGNVTFTAFNGSTNGKACSFTLYLRQDGTGGRTVTFPGSVKWSGSAPVLSTTPNAVDILVFETLNGGGEWFGSLVGTNFA